MRVIGKLEIFGNLIFRALTACQAAPRSPRTKIRHASVFAAAARLRRTGIGFRDDAHAGVFVREWL